MKRILITGLTGKSGNVFLQLLGTFLERTPYQIRAVVRQEEQQIQIHRYLPEAETVVGNLRDSIFLDQISEQVDILFHIAGIHWTLPLVQACALHGVRRMVLVHTTGIYSKYKAAGEEYRQIEDSVDQLANVQGITVTYLRPTMIYGTLNDRNMIQFIRIVDRFNPMPVVNGGTYNLQPVNYKDLGKAYMQVLEHLDTLPEKSYILSGKDVLSLKEIFELIAETLGIHRTYFSVPFPVAYLGAWSIYLLSVGRIDFREKVQRLCEDRSYSHEAASRDFGYNPMPFSQGLKEEVLAYQAQKSKSEKLQ